MRPASQNTETRKQRARRARWKRNKQAERKRKAVPPLAPLPDAMKNLIWRERDRRIEAIPTRFFYLAEALGLYGSWEFHCDVWAARTIIEIQNEGRIPTAGKVAKWMGRNQLSHGYQPNSLRTMVYRAYEAIALYEKTQLSGTSTPIWSQFSIGSKCN